MTMRRATGSGRWYPSPKQLENPQSTEQAFRQLLDQHYDLQDSVAAMREQMAKPTANLGASGSASPPGSGPSDTMLLGLRVTPIDVQTLANGATLKWNKLKGQFEVV